MDKSFKKLSSLAALGLIAGAMGQVHAASPNTMCVEPSAGQAQKLLSQLDREHQDMFNNMDCEGKNMALSMANQTCKGKNACAGMNACASSKNDCKGQGSCKGTAVKPFKNKNEAVDAANMQMNKRMQSMDDE